MRSDQAQTVDDTKTVQIIAEVMNAVESESKTIGTGITERNAAASEIFCGLDRLWAFSGRLYQLNVRDFVANGDAHIWIPFERGVRCIFRDPLRQVK